MIRFITHRKPHIRKHLAGCQLAWAVVRIPMEGRDLEGYCVGFTMGSAILLGCALTVAADFYRFAGADHLASLSAGYIAEMIAVLVYQADTNSRQSCLQMKSQPFLSQDRSRGAAYHFAGNALLGRGLTAICGGRNYSKTSNRTDV
jgi:hypothetical protein